MERQSQNLYTITVGTDRPYAVYVHNGTRKLKARRFITDGINKASGDMKDILRNEMKSASSVGIDKRKIFCIILLDKHKNIQSKGNESPPKKRSIV